MKSLPYNYFAARLLGWNGSRSRIIAQVSGCWDDEMEAHFALEEAVAYAKGKFCDGLGLDPEDDDSEDRFIGIDSDYQRTSIEFDVTPTVDGQLAHNLSETINSDSVPSFA